MEPAPPSGGFFWVQIRRDPLARSRWAGSKTAAIVRISQRPELGLLRAVEVAEGATAPVNLGQGAQVGAHHPRAAPESAPAAWPDRPHRHEQRDGARGPRLTGMVPLHRAEPQQFAGSSGSMAAKQAEMAVGQAFAHHHHAVEAAIGLAKGLAVQRIAELEIQSNRCQGHGQASAFRGRLSWRRLR